MTLIKSVSGIRGTIGGKPSQGLTPIDIVAITSAFGKWAIDTSAINKIVIGRDGRISGKIVKDLVIATLQSLGIDIIDLDYSTTPTVEMAVVHHKAGAGIILTASHNPKEWNALKLLNQKGEFISALEGEQVLKMADENDFTFAEVDALGTVSNDHLAIQRHIDAILAMLEVNVEAIKSKNFKVVVDAVNSTGSISVIPLLERLGVKEITLLNGEITGHFAHNPEPLPEHLQELKNGVIEHKADIGISIDPDVDRLSLINEDGSFFGEEYTLVAIADYMLSIKKGNTVSNLSSSRALKDIAIKHGVEHFASAVGEVHVVNKMKDNHARIGGEGNGGIIVPELHYGRDALVGIALFLTHLAKSGLKMSELKASYPSYFISKNKISLTPEINVDEIIKKVSQKYSDQSQNNEDGLRIDFEREWVHLRKSNTEPIIRIYSESKDEDAANQLAERIMADIQSFK